MAFISNTSINFKFVIPSNDNYNNKAKTFQEKQAVQSTTSPSQLLH